MNEFMMRWLRRVGIRDTVRRLRRPRRRGMLARTHSKHSDALRRVSVVGGLSFILGACSEDPTAVSEISVPGSGWQQYAVPEEAGWSSQGLEDARQYAQSLGSAAVMVVYRGIVVAAWGNVTRKIRAHSVRKMFLSSMFGRPVSQGQLGLDMTLAQLGIDDIGVLTDEEKTARVEHLLTATSGVYHPAAKTTPEWDASTPPRGSHLPGTYFWYNNWDFNTLGTIFEQQTGLSVFEAFRLWIADPIGMEDFHIADNFYEYERRKSMYPAYAFRVSTRDMARFGQLFLQRGQWASEEVVSADWVDLSTRSHVNVEPGTGFGYMWWVFPAGKLPSSPTLSLYGAFGSGGQRIIVIPDAETVIVHRGETDFAEGVPNTWELIDRIALAKVSDPVAEPTLTSFTTKPFSYSFPPVTFPTRIQLPAEVLDRYVGQYDLIAGPVPTIEIDRLDDFLILYVPGLGEADLFPTTEREFFTRAAMLLVEFELDAKDDVSGVVITDRANGEVVTGTRVSP